MNILVACEESQAVTIEMRKKGHNAFSCDVIDCSGGHPEQKATCLWLKGLPNLVETDNVKDYMMTLPHRERSRIWWLGSGHAKERSKTFPGVAKAMAEQWANH